MKRGQAALEFLMTYGWVILIVIIVIGALAAFGVFDVARLVPDKCVLPTQLSCQDHGASSGLLQMELLNSFGRDIEINSITITDRDTGDTCTETYATPLSIDNQYKQLVEVGDCGWLEPKSGKYRLDLEVEYKFADGTIVKTLRGDVTTTVED